MTLTTAFAWCGRLLAWLVILGVATVLAACVLVPRVAGATPYTILTGSMRPSMPPGTLVVVRPVPADRIGVGDVITYQLRSGQPEVVTHRVVAVGVDGAGHRVFRTQGDANDTADAAWVRPVQVKGVRWYAVPQLGRVTNVLDGAQRHLVLVASVVTLLLYSAWMFLGELRDRRGGSRRRPVAVVPAYAEVGHG